MYPAVLFANVESDTLCLGKSLIYKKYEGSPNAVVLSNAQSAKPKKNFFKNMRYSGYARLFVLHRQMQEYYNIAPTNGLSLPVNLTVGDGYQQPLLLFTMQGNPTAKTYFNMELQFDHRLLSRYTTGPFISDTLGRGASLYVIFKMEGAIETKIGKFKLTAGGGANWFRISQTTLWGYQYRDDLFDRYPWEPEGNDFSRYNSSYAVGDIPRDQRFGMAATQGFILEGTNLPAGFNAALLYGKTQYSGGFQSYLTKNPQNFVAGKLEKKLGDHKLGVNFFNQFGYTANKVKYKGYISDNGVDSFYVEDNRMSTLITTMDGKFEFKKFDFYAEVGAGSYLSSTYNKGLKGNLKTGTEHASRYKRDWSETMFFELATKKELTYLPIKLSYYRIGRYIVNNSSSIANTSVENAKSNPNVPDRYYTNYFDGMVTDIGQLANNRQGINLFTNKDFGKLKARLGLGMAQELVNLVGDLRNGARGRALSAADSNALVPFTNSITFEHRLNSVTRSRFGFYERFTGPYGRVHSIFRHAYDNIAITDTVVDYKKSFSTAQLDLKYKLKLLGKELLMTNYINYSSVQDNWSPIPVFSDKAFLRYFYEEFMTFYSIHPKVTIVGFWGMERVIGNNRTELADANGKLITNAQGRPVADVNGKAIDQTGYGYGLGLDYNFHSSASINIRQRWFSHKDKNFTLDRFSGNEMTFEFKVFF